MKELAQRNRSKLIDRLNERLTFERTGVKLYDSLLVKMQQSRDPSIAPMLPQIRQQRDEEKEHEVWLEAQIRALGGDAHASTESSRLVETESEGIAKIVMDGDPELPHAFHALLAAELVDGAGWQLLLELADDADDAEAREAFRQRLHEEDRHLMFMREVVERFARKDVLGEDVSLPSSV